MKSTWSQKPCGCIKTDLHIGRVVIRCERHRGKRAWRRTRCHFDDDGIVRIGK